jgi:hypothetical protein
MLLVFGKRAGPHSMQQFNRLSRPARRPRVRLRLLDSKMANARATGRSIRPSYVYVVGMWFVFESCQGFATTTCNTY